MPSPPPLFRQPLGPNRTILMVAFHFPPCGATSGAHRTERFARYLPEFGWHPLVLTAHPRAYPARQPHPGEPSHHSSPNPVFVARAFALDAARSLSFRGRYPQLFAMPDRWWSWWPFAVLTGLRLIQHFRPTVLWSTCPIPTAHLVALALHRYARLPWVADFRDPMTEENYPPQTTLRTLLRRIERLVAAHASILTFTTASACSLYRTRYRLTSEAAAIIPNGYDAADLDDLPISEPRPVACERPVRIVHAGMVYENERNPRALFSALAALKSSGLVAPSGVVFIFRGSATEQFLRAQVATLGLDDLVVVLPPVSHREALRECAQADALLVIQASPCNRQIPAKVYEYLRLNRPILALTDPGGETARLLRRTGGATILPLDPEVLVARLPDFVTAVRRGIHESPSPEITAGFSRRNQTALLASRLDAIAGV